MKLFVVTNSAGIENEHKIIEKMFRRGLRCLHVRKPKFTRSKMVEYIEGFSKQYRDRIVIHSHHSLALNMGLKGIHLTEKHRNEGFNQWKKLFLYRIRRKDLQISTSYHKLQEIKNSNKKFDYVFLSPVFESISKEKYTPSYSLATIYDTLRNTDLKVVALGGIDDEKVDRCYNTLFWGIALSGYLWQAEDPVKNFEIVNELCSQYKMQS
jgi:thiamine-phosphate pyrophosphorylase